MKKAARQAAQSQEHERSDLPEVDPVRNPNHPRKGDVIKVEAIRREKDINLIKKLLADKPRDLAIFTMGINTNLRASDLLRITIGQVQHVRPGEQFSLREKKTQKLRSITMNKTVSEAVQKLLKTVDTSDSNAYLFRSRQKRNGGQLTVGYLNRLVKGWCAEINLKGNYGSHTLRKTFGVAHRTRFGTDIPTLMTMFNHATQRQTLAYLGVQTGELQEAYLREI
jgi:integrase